MHVQHHEHCHSCWVVDFPQAWSCFGTVALQKPGGEKKKKQFTEKVCSPMGIRINSPQLLFFHTAYQAWAQMYLSAIGGCLLGMFRLIAPFTSKSLKGLLCLSFWGNPYGSLLNPTRESFPLKEIQNYNPFRQLKNFIKEAIKELSTSLTRLFTEAKF